ncbi:MAG: hypothetical protein Fur0032_21100 [Terrimicrobiaceae bacterium]
MRPEFSKAPRGFTLVEVVVLLGVVAVLAALTFPSLSRSTSRAETAGCAAKLRSLGNAIHLYALDNQGEFPRSFHSAGAFGQPGWTSSIFPYLSGGSGDLDAENFRRLYRCPSHSEKNPFIYSYGMNVHFELDPNGDDYTGSPATWRRVSQVPHPTRTILLGESRPVPFGDHLMCHQWSTSTAAKNALAADRHEGRPSFLFVDGHVENLKPEQTLDPARNLNLWNPSLAGKSASAP